MMLFLFWSRDLWVYSSSVVLGSFTACGAPLPQAKIMFFTSVAELVIRRFLFVFFTSVAVDKLTV